MTPDPQGARPAWRWDATGQTLDALHARVQRLQAAQHALRQGKPLPPDAIVGSYAFVALACLEVLEAVEWGATSSAGGDYYCAAGCSGIKDAIPHAPSCLLGRILGRLPAPPVDDSGSAG